MTRPTLLLGGVALVLATGGCAYFNSLYNARRLYAEGEEARRRGEQETAMLRYGEAIERAARSYRSDRDGPWADDALYLVGRAYFRLGEWNRARAALRQVRDGSPDQELRLAALLYLGIVDVAAGEAEKGIAGLSLALRELEDRSLLAEGHLWRARAHLRAGRVSPGWWDLDRAVETDARVRTPADLERLLWGVATDDRTRAADGARALLASRAAAGSADSVQALVRIAATRWGAAEAVALLDEAEDAPWPPEARDRLLLVRAELHAEAGDGRAAVRNWERVSGEVGEVAEAARIRHARWRLARTTELAELDEARSILLPALESDEALTLLDGIMRLRLMVERGRSGSAPALFLAAETARDVLGAPRLARSLFLAYADAEAGTPWEGKALLAAVALTDASDEREELLRRARELPRNPYVRGAVEGHTPSAEFEEAERRFAEALEAVRRQVEQEAAERDVLVARSPRGGG